MLVEVLAHIYIEICAHFAHYLFVQRIGIVNGMYILAALIEIGTQTVAHYLALGPVDTGIAHLFAAALNDTSFALLVRRNSSCGAHFLADMAF